MENNSLRDELKQIDKNMTNVINLLKTKSLDIISFLKFIIINKDILSEIYQNDKTKLSFENIYEIKYDYTKINVNDFIILLELAMKFEFFSPFSEKILINLCSDNLHYLYNVIELYNEYNKNIKQKNKDLEENEIATINFKYLLEIYQNFFTDKLNNNKLKNSEKIKFLSQINEINENKPNTELNKKVFSFIRTSNFNFIAYKYFVKILKQVKKDEETFNYIFNHLFELEQNPDNFLNVLKLFQYAFDDGVLKETIFTNQNNFLEKYSQLMNMSLHGKTNDEVFHYKEKITEIIFYFYDDLDLQSIIEIFKDLINEDYYRPKICSFIINKNLPIKNTIIEYLKEKVDYVNQVYLLDISNLNDLDKIISFYGPQNRIKILMKMNCYFQSEDKNKLQIKVLLHLINVNYFQYKKNFKKNKNDDDKNKENIEFENIENEFCSETFNEIEELKSHLGQKLISNMHLENFYKIIKSYPSICDFINNFDKIESENMINSVEKNVKLYKSNKEKIEEVKHFKETFFKNDSSENSFLKDYDEKSIFELENENNQNQLKNILDLYEEAKKFNILNKSLIFKSIVRYEKKLISSLNDLDLKKIEKIFFEGKFLLDIEAYNKIDFNKIEIFLYYSIDIKENDKNINFDCFIDEVNFLEEKYNLKLEEKNKVNIRIYLEYIYKILFLYKFIQYFEIIIKKFEKNNIQLSEFYENLKKFENLIESKSNINDLMDYFKKVDLNITYEDNIYQILNRLLKTDNLLDFLISKEYDEARHLNDFIEEGNDNGIINDSAGIQDYIDVVAFIEEIKAFNNIKDKQFYEDLKNICEKQINMKYYITSVDNNLKSIQEAYNSINDLQKNSINLLKEIIRESTFELIRDKTNLDYHWKITYENNKQIELSVIIENKNRLMMKNEKNNNENNNDYNLGEIKAKIYYLINELKNIFDYVEILNNKGFYEIKLKLLNKNGELHGELNNQKKIPIKNLKSDLQGYINNINEIENKYYKNEEIIRFLYGKQFSLIYDYILLLKDKNKNEEKQIQNKNIKNFLNYLFGKTNVKDYEIECDIKIQEKFQKQINEINIFLLNLLEKYNLDILEHFYNKNRIKDLIKLKEIEYYQIDNERVKDVIYEGNRIEISIESTILGLYYKFTKNNLPLPFNILYCNKYTSCEEIEAFLTRVVYCKYRVLFTIVNIPLLELLERKYLYERLNYYYKKQKFNKNSTLIFIVEEMTNDFQIELFELKCHKLEMIQLRDVSIQFLQGVFGKENNKFETDNKINIIKIVQSEKIGSGKTFFIKNEAKTLDKKYIYFPISGKITNEKLLQDLKSKNIEFHNSLIHIDILENFIDKERILILKDFLFNILVFKYFHYKEDYFYIGTNLVIMVEAPSEFKNFFKNFNFLKIFTNCNIGNIPFQSKFNFQDNDQIICNYLCLQEYIFENYDLNIENVTLNKGGYFLEAKKISNDDIKEILERKFPFIDKMNYYQKINVMNCIGEDLKFFNNNPYLSATFLEFLDEVDENIKKFRTLYLNQIFDMVEKYYFNKVYDILSHNQKIAIKYFNNEISNDEVIQQTQQIDNINKLEKDFIFINDDKDKTLTVILKEEDKDKENFIKKINKFVDDYELKTKIKKQNRSKIISNFSNYSQKDFQELMLLMTGNENINHFINISYIFTYDNFIKIIFILLRIRGKTPFILLGETGCGKTSLIKLLAKLKNVNLKILNIHSGITENDIIKFMNEVFKEINQKSFVNYWIFFDEINTCNSMGLIMEIMINHSIKGKIFDCNNNNIFFMAACNPFRPKSKISIHSALELYDENENSDKKRFIYTVYPMPISLLNYVFYFGALSIDDEKLYINSIVEAIKKPDNVNHVSIINKDNPALKPIVNSISACHCFIRDKFGDNSSVSLRELGRFSILFQYYYKYFLNKRNRDFSEKNILTYCAIFCIYLCYIIRLPQRTMREALQEKIETILKDQINKIKIKNIIENELNEFISNVDLGKGIAKNKIIIENLYCVYICIINKIPLFICGKPGCSKSLSIMTIYKSMKGNNSEQNLFKKLPKLSMNSYQGSLSSTSEGIKKAFNKTRSVITEKNHKEIISMLFFDEMGLAEKSLNNPLKILHSELEENNDTINFNNDKEKIDKKIAFIGISNYYLDASKMNRGILLSIPEMEESDLIETAKNIADSYSNSKFENYDKFLVDLYRKKLVEYSFIIENLAKTFFKYMNYLKEKFSKDKNFHGTRDFYYLIKQTSILLIDLIERNKDKIIEEEKKKEEEKNEQKQIENYLKANYSDESDDEKERIEENEEDEKEKIEENIKKEEKNLQNDLNYKEKETEEINSIIFNCVQRNFDGKKFENKPSTSIFLDFYNENDLNLSIPKSKYHNNIKESILSNIKDKDSRFLLLICPQSISKFIIDFILTSANISYNFFIGSYFEDDIKDENYSIEILNKIKICLEQGNILCLQNFESIYPSLYDLFNLNFTVVKGKNYTRFALKGSSVTMTQVNNDFRAIILMDENFLRQQQPPFLNRFEKHHVNFKNLLDKKFRDFGLKIYQDLLELFRNYNKEKFLFVVKQKEEIFGMIFAFLQQKNDLNENEILDKILNKIVPTFSNKMIKFLEENDEKENELKNKILHIYNQKKIKNLEEFIKNISSHRNIIYTYSNILEVFNISNNIKAINFDTVYFNENTKEELLISSYKTKDNLEKDLRFFINNNLKNLLIIKFNLNDSIHLHYIQDLLFNIEKNENLSLENVNNFIIYMINIPDDLNIQENNSLTFVSHLTSYCQYFIENINKK